MPASQSTQSTPTTSGGRARELANQSAHGARLLRSVVRAVRDAQKQAAYHQPAPPANGFVVDLGAGHAPHPLADLVVDKYVDDNFERESALALHLPLVVADGHQMPFADGAFSYVVASHVLEHATDPILFASELSRVAAAGFVQVPSREAELTFGWPFHPWLIDLHDGVLAFHARGDQAAPMGELFHKAAAESLVFSLWFGQTRSTWHHTVHWSDDLQVTVSGPSTAERTAELDLERTLHVLSQGHARGPAGPLRETLRCPVDGGVLVDQGERLVCQSCDRGFQQPAGVPVLLKEAAS